MQTGLTQKPTADAAGGSRACALTLHVIIVPMSSPTPGMSRSIAGPLRLWSERGGNDEQREGSEGSGEGQARGQASGQARG